MAASDKSASEIARRHGLNPNLVFSWRKKFAADAHLNTTGKEVCLVPVERKALFGSECNDVRLICYPLVRCFCM